MDITSDTEGSDDDRPGVVDGNDGGCPGMVVRDADISMEVIPTHSILLESVVDSEYDDNDLEDEGPTPETEDPVDEIIDTEDNGVDTEDDGFGTEELNIVPPWPTCSGGDKRLPYTAGCVWTEEDWSCSYDAVFMAFWSLYEQSSPTWRNDWVQRAPEWNVPLGNNFDHLLILTDTPIGIQNRAKWFCCYRDRFRDQLSRKDPKSFPRRGRLPASASRILEIIFGRTAGPYLVQHLICGSCGVQSQAECEFCFLLLTCRRNNPSPVWLRTAWEEFIHRSKTNAARTGTTCPRCPAPNNVEVLRMPDVPWIWFERDHSSSVWPSLTLAFDSPPQRLTYSLRAVIYAGSNHFTVRFREQSGMWWRHDGRVASGVPQPDNVQSEAELLMNDTRFACTLIYRRDNY